MATKTKEQVVKVPVADMGIAYGTQSREQMDTEVVKEFAERMKAGDKFPPVILYEEDRTDKYEGKPVLIMGDGFKRRAAASLIGLAELDAVVRKGTKFEALQCNITENIPQTGERYSIPDRRHAARMVLSEPEGAAKSNAWIADLCRVSESLVADVRAQVERETGRPGGSHRTGRDNRKYKAKKPRREPGDETGDGKKPKQGGPKYNWRELNRALGIVIRAPEDIARAYKGEKDGTAYPAAKGQIDKLELLVKIFRGWERSCMKLDKAKE